MATQKVICDTDALIAATSLGTGLKLFTYNKRDFKFIKGLKLYDSK